MTSKYVYVHVLGTKCDSIHRVGDDTVNVPSPQPLCVGDLVARVTRDAQAVVVRLRNLFSASIWNILLSCVLNASSGTLGSRPINVAV
jgi:hypothetical protein